MSSNSNSKNNLQHADAEAPRTLAPASALVSHPATAPAAAIGLDRIPQPITTLPPVPPAQLTAAYDDMDAAIKEHAKHARSHVSDPPLPPVQIAAEYDDMKDSIKASVEQKSNDARLPPSHIAALAEEMNDGKMNAKKKPSLMSGGYDDAPQVPSAKRSNRERGSMAEPQPALYTPREQNGTLLQAHTPPSVPVPSLPPMDHDQRSSNTSIQPQIPISPPPQSMLPYPNEGTNAPSVPVPALDPSIPVLEATLVENTERDWNPIEVYDAVQITEKQSWLKKNQKYICGMGMGLLVGGAFSVGLVVRSNNNAPNSNTKSEESDDPRIQSVTSAPTNSELGNDSRFQPNTYMPLSGIPSLRPSLIPSRSMSPTSFCFGAEIKILTDDHPEETRWKLSRVINIDGIITTEVVLQGSPEDKGRQYTHEVCLERGEYEFTILDTAGNGVCCSSGEGYYSMTIDGVAVVQGDEFRSQETVLFTLPIPSLQPSSRSSSPSEMPSSSRSSSPSEIPSSSFLPSPWPSSPPSTYFSSLGLNLQDRGIEGEASADQLGDAVAFSRDGMTMAIGAPGIWVDKDRPGYVKVYRRKGEGSSSWKQRGDTVYGVANGAEFGSSLSLSGNGNTLCIGAPRNDENGSEAGYVKVYEWDEEAMNYNQRGDTLIGGSANADFGMALALSEDARTLAVGAPYASYRGQVTVYGWDELSSSYKSQGKVINGETYYEYFGHSLSLSLDGKTLAVGAPYSDTKGDRAGQVTIYHWDEDALNYERLGGAIDGNATYHARFGHSVSLSGDGKLLAVGAPYDHSNALAIEAEDSGKVQVFTFNKASLIYEQRGQIIFGKENGDYFGYSVDLSSDGNIMAIGAPQLYNWGPGFAEVYGWDEAALNYEQLGSSLSGETANDWFGTAVALSAEGKVLAVGAPENDGIGLSRSGQVQVFNIEC